MRLAHGRHLAYRLEAATGAAWRARVLAVRDHVCRPGEELGLSLRFDELAARELLAPGPLAEFRRWLAAERCYVCTLDEPPADWTRPETLAHACRLLDGLGELLPEGVDGSVSLSFTETHRTEADLQAIYANLIHAAVHAAEVSGCAGRRVRLALAVKTARFLEPLVDTFPDQCGACLDVSCTDKPAAALAAFDRAEIPVVKTRLGSSSHAADVLDWLATDASCCPHLEVAGDPNDGPTDYLRALAGFTERGLA